MIICCFFSFSRFKRTIVSHGASLNYVLRHRCIVIFWTAWNNNVIVVNFVSTTWRVYSVFHLNVSSFVSNLRITQYSCDPYIWWFAYSSCWWKPKDKKCKYILFTLVISPLKMLISSSKAERQTEIICLCQNVNIQCNNVTYWQKIECNEGSKWGEILGKKIFLLYFSLITYNNQAALH